MIPLGADDAAELETALTALNGTPPREAEAVPLPRLGMLLRGAAARLDTGRGFALLRGLPLDKLGEAAAEPALLALGAHLGRAAPDGVGRLTSPAGTAARWRFHADAADIVALLVLRQPPEADPVMLVSAAAVHNEVLKRDRRALEALYAAWPHAAPGQPARLADMPVFSIAGGAFIGRYARDAIEAAQRLPETPRLSAAQMEALDLLDAICAGPGLALRLDVRPGDVLLFNPLQVWKRRAETLADGGDSTRIALRLLLTTATSRATPEGMTAIGSAPGSGMVGG